MNRGAATATVLAMHLAGRNGEMRRPATNYRSTQRSGATSLPVPKAGLGVGRLVGGLARTAIETGLAACDDGYDARTLRKLDATRAERGKSSTVARATSAFLVA